MQRDSFYKRSVLEIQYWFVVLCLLSMVYYAKPRDRKFEEITINSIFIQRLLHCSTVQTMLFAIVATTTMFVRVQRFLLSYKYNSSLTIFCLDVVYVHIFRIALFTWLYSFRSLVLDNGKCQVTYFYTSYPLITVHAMQ